MTMTLPAVLAISGSDSSGGAGAQADLKTMLANGVFGMSAITALTAQNTLGVRAIQDTEPAVLADQIDAVFEDIPPAAVKIGMVSSAALIDVIAARLTAHHARNVVLDPVMVATSGARLIGDDAIAALTGRLFPLATLITPNVPEAQVLLEAAAGGAVALEAADWGDGAPEAIRTPRDMERAALAIARAYGCAALVKGGHAVNDANDVLGEPDGTVIWFEGRRVDNPNTHGTGCTLSSAIAANLAKGEPLADAIRHAKAYLTGALEAGLDLGHGSGPMDHAWRWRGARADVRA
ncbi:hydroxymethylpyrimidine/phosphomethylpyrimidine kinase [Bifidobacterium pullorum subsp. saeculare]|uniref:Hydroxymethylpyrimidine/phosphomethylpyrimidine kinase n=1 Tax=Bifidobacterium pullorum subsp. saeculare TaxID=78257 RepID=A0A939B9S9_9BIFI|nr:bifunctional hydroxymethylpyrimidine kinase/phosphomethylpyrimidine kinase [Bifidobacterium pullorum]MBM6699156.1 hydroxymethylpyrimidine/phosphomethylpyrimidine kinase [Bifidobacterium pullorum subsp. saeculare]